MKPVSAGGRSSRSERITARSKETKGTYGRERDKRNTVERKGLRLMADSASVKEDTKKLATKEELQDSLRNVVRKKDLEPLATKKDIDELKPKPGIKRWLNANWAGILVASLALIVSTLSMCETQKHQRLSVRPYVTTSFNANETGAGWIRGINGAGPAIINAFEVTVDGKPVQTWDGVLIALGIDPLGAKFTFKIPWPGTSLLPSDTTAAVFWLNSPPTAVATLVKESHRVQLKLTYCSLYDECWERISSGDQFEPTSVPKKKSILAFGASKQWREGYSGGQ
jgi:hypothetical protein